MIERTKQLTPVNTHTIHHHRSTRHAVALAVVTAGVTIACVTVRTCPARGQSPHLRHRDRFGTTPVTAGARPDARFGRRDAFTPEPARRPEPLPAIAARDANLRLNQTSAADQNVDSTTNNESDGRNAAAVEPLSVFEKLGIKSRKPAAARQPRATPTKATPAKATPTEAAPSVPERRASGIVPSVATEKTERGIRPKRLPSVNPPSRSAATTGGTPPAETDPKTSAETDPETATETTAATDSGRDSAIPASTASATSTGGFSLGDVTRTVSMRRGTTAGGHGSGRDRASMQRRAAVERPTANVRSMASGAVPSVRAGQYPSPALGYTPLGGQVAAFDQQQARAQAMAVGMPMPAGQFPGTQAPDQGLPSSGASICGNPGVDKLAIAGDFSPTPLPEEAMTYSAERERLIYDDKHDVPTQRPLIEWGRLWYSDGITPRGINLFGATNMVRPKFWVYGDYRMGAITGQNAATRTDNMAMRYNLDFDFWITDSERFHAFVQPFERGGDRTGIDFSGDEIDFNTVFDVNPVTGFFEGDLGAMLGGVMGTASPMEIPITFGLVPLLFQNGVWMEDAVTGGAITYAGRNSPRLRWSNYDLTFFGIVDQLNSPAFGGDEHAAQAAGAAIFIEAYEGYIEAGYAYLNDRNFEERSYHNITASFTRRYLMRFSNSVRVIVNAGQDLPEYQRTADGALITWENSYITANPLTFVPYWNLFAGFGRPQSVARAAAAGGILRNIGLNFDTDGINGLGNLFATGEDSFGGAIGVDLIGKDLDRQLVVEAAYVSPQGSGNPNLPDDQFGLGARYQFPISNATLLRFDAMHGWRRGLDDVFGVRAEYRWKF